MANEAGEYKTQDGGFRGTLSYAAPETLQGSPASPQSDLYSCGVVLYQLLSGANPIKGQEPNETLYRVLHHVPPPVRSLRDDVPEAISDAIDRAISKDPSDRFESASAFAEALRAGSTWDDDPAANGLSGFAGTPCNPPSNAQPGATCSDGKPKYRTNWPTNLGTITNAIDAINVGVAYKF